MTRARWCARRRWWAGLVAVAVLAVGCGGSSTLDGATGGGGAEPSDDGSDAGGTLRLYTSVTQDTVDAVVDAYREDDPSVEVEVFRAPTGELTARLAAEQREGEILADVLWLTDPLSMQTYAADGMLRDWTPEQATVVPEAFQGEEFWGTRILNLVIVAAEGLDPAPTSWQDLADPDLDEPVALPDPGFAGSAFGALAYFAAEPEFGFDYYRALDDAGAVQVQAPGEVVTGVAEGRFSAGITLDKSARTAVEKGSPVELVFPEPGAIALYSPIAVTAATDEPDAAEGFANFTLTRPAQQRIAETGWEPIRDDVDWPHDGPTVTTDWEAAFDRRDDLLERYRSILGG